MIDKIREHRGEGIKKQKIAVISTEGGSASGGKRVLCTLCG